MRPQWTLLVQVVPVGIGVGGGEGVGGEGGGGRMETDEAGQSHPAQ